MSDARDGLDALLAEADALIAVRRYDAAVDRARLAASVAPEDLRAYCEWSRALHGAGRDAEAARMADEAIRLAPDVASGFRLRSAALATLARKSSRRERARLGEEAVASAREAVRLAPWDANGFLGLAQALPLTGDAKGADAAVQDLIRLAPNSAATWVAASLVALGARNWTAAISASRKALAIDPANYAALNNLGVALRAAGRKREGTEVSARAARLQPDAPTARSNLSRAGLNVVRIGILVILIPIGLLAHVGLGLYVLFAIGSNLVISRNPGLALRVERWAAPVALFFAKRSDGSTKRATVRVTESARESPMEQPWSAVRGHYRVRTPLLLIFAILTWPVALLFLVGLFLPIQGKTGFAAAFVAFAAVAAWPTIVIIRRRRDA